MTRERRIYEVYRVAGNTATTLALTLSLLWCESHWRGGAIALLVIVSHVAGHGEGLWRPSPSSGDGHGD